MTWDRFLCVTNFQFFFYKICVQNQWGHKLWDPRSGLPHWRSKFDSRDGRIIISFSVLILWTLCEKSGYLNCRWIRGVGVGQEVLFRATWSCIVAFLVLFCRLVLLNSEAQENILLTSLLSTWANPIHPVDEVIPSIPVLIKEIKMLGESKDLYFLFLVLIKGMRSRGFLCKTPGVESFS